MTKIQKQIVQRGKVIVGIKFDNFPVETEDKFFKQMHKEVCAEDVRKKGRKI